MRLMVERPGWEILEDGQITAFKSPGPVPFVNFVYGEATKENYQKVRKFYSSQSFMWLLKEGQSGRLLTQLGFKGPQPTPEMVMNLNQYAPVDMRSPDREVVVADTADRYEKWIGVAAGWINVDRSIIDAFFTPLIQTGKFIPFLAFYKGEPAATSLVYCGNAGAALYCLGTLSPFRSLGLGSAVTHACLCAAKNQHIDKAVLYASALGKPLYEKIGFKTVQILGEYASEK